MDTIDQQILEKVSCLEPAPKQPYTACARIRLPIEEQNAILQAQRAQSTNEDFEMFEAYSEEDLADTCGRFRGRLS